MQSLTNDSGYYRAQLTNKLLNYAPEISPHMNSTIFKQLVSGEPIEARFPYGKPFIIENYAKLIFNTNELPKDVEHNEAFFRRFLILHFNVTIPEKDRDPDLAQKIIREELPGVFNWVLEGLHRLLMQKRFTPSEAVANAVNLYKNQSNTVKLFLDDEGYTPYTNSVMPLQLLYRSYHNYCTNYHYKPCALRSFSDRLRNLGIEPFRKNSGMFVNISK